MTTTKSFPIRDTDGVSLRYSITYLGGAWRVVGDGIDAVVDARDVGFPSVTNVVAQAYRKDGAA